jgi:hypothetical protein
MLHIRLICSLCFFHFRQLSVSVCKPKHFFTHWNLWHITQFNCSFSCVRKPYIRWKLDHLNVSRKFSERSVYLKMLHIVESNFNLVVTILSMQGSVSLNFRIMFWKSDLSERVYLYPSGKAHKGMNSCSLHLAGLNKCIYC